MKKYRLKSNKVIDGVCYLVLEPASANNVLDFTPGQYAAIGFKNKLGKRTTMRCFSIVSSANNGSELMFTIRVGGHFTTALTRLSEGAKFYIEGPFGDFVIDRNTDRKLVMIAGGIGITPFISMLRTNYEDRDNIPTTLLYSYRGGHHIPYQQMFDQLAKRNPYFKTSIFSTAKTESPNEPRLFSGRMNEAHIKEVIGREYAQATYFVCGPKGFMDHTIGMLEKNGVSEDRIITESFTQSSKVLTKTGQSIPKLTYMFASLVMLVGIVFVSFIDLSRASAVRHISGSTSGSPSVSNSGSTGSASNGSSSYGSSTNSASSGSYTSAGSSTSQSYQQPVSTVS